MEGNYYFVYILASMSGTLYIGVTNDLKRRLAEHHSKIHLKSFTARYDCKRLVYYERFLDISEAIAREKELKGWLRCKKVALIMSRNPGWRDIAMRWKLPVAVSYDQE